jgi:hypothetical protein
LEIVYFNQFIAFIIFLFDHLYDKLLRKLFMKKFIVLISVICILLSCNRMNKNNSVSVAISIPDSLSNGVLDGRMILMFSKNKDKEPRFDIVDGPTTQLAFGKNVENWQKGMVITLAKMADIPPGKYYVQALLHKYERFKLKTGHNVKLPMDRGEGQQWNLAPGNLYSTPQLVDVGANGTISVNIDKKIAPIVQPKDTEWIKHVKIKSQLLSDFWGRDMYIGAHVLLPQGYQTHPTVKYPLAIFHGHFPDDFGGFSTTPPDSTKPCIPSERFGLACYNRTQDQEAYDFYKMWSGPNFPRVLAIEIVHPTPYYDDSYAVNTACQGPYGDAIVKELIPHIEKTYRGIGEGWARFMYGGSTGGWEAMAAQVFYPDEFNGAYIACPDPIDFRAYLTIDIYKDKNAYFLDNTFKKTARPSHRNYLGHVDATIQENCDRELVLGDKSRSGQQFDIWEATFSPMDEEGYPKRIWDRMTGDIDSSVAKYWKENYDLTYILKRDWKTLGPKLRGKMRIYCGDMDNFYLNNAVYLAEDFLKSTKEPYYDGEVDYGDRAEHCWNGDHSQPNAISRLRYHQMFIPKWTEHMKKTTPAGKDLSSWRY